MIEADRNAIEAKVSGWGVYCCDIFLLLPIAVGCSQRLLLVPRRPIHT